MLLEGGNGSCAAEVERQSAAEHAAAVQSAVRPGAEECGNERRRSVRTRQRAACAALTAHSLPLRLHRRILCAADVRGISARCPSEERSMQCGANDLTEMADLKERAVRTQPARDKEGGGGSALSCRVDIQTRTCCRCERRRLSLPSLALSFLLLSPCISSALVAVPLIFICCDSVALFSGSHSRVSDSLCCYACGPMRMFTDKFPLLTFSISLSVAFFQPPFSSLSSIRDVSSSALHVILSCPFYFCSLHPGFAHSVKRDRTEIKHSDSCNFFDPQQFVSVHRPFGIRSTV